MWKIIHHAAGLLFLEEAGLVRGEESGFGYRAEEVTDTCGAN